MSPELVLCGNAGPAMDSTKQETSAHRMKLIMEFLLRYKSISILKDRSL
jgi:hypothetical protein